MNKKLIIFGFVGMGIFFISYALLGGFSTIQVKLEETKPLYLKGKKYLGKVDTEDFQKLVYGMMDLKKNGSLEGEFTICYWGNPDEGDSIKAMVGVSSFIQFPTPTDSLVLDSVALSSVLVGSFDTHFLGAPSPSRVNDKIQAFAETRGFLLESIYIERYIEDNNIITVVPIKTTNLDD